MNYAIYFVAVGDSAIKCLKLAYHSLRKAGFAGDVYIFTDGTDIPFKTSANTRVARIKEEDLNLDPLSTAPMAACDVRRFNKATISENKYHSFNKWAIANMRTLVDSYIPFEKYDYILYLDVDVLVRGPAQRFEKFMEQHRGVILLSTAKDSRRLGGRGNFSLKKLRRAKTTEAANLITWELLKYWFVQPICSDIVCFPTDELGKRFLREWRVECQKGIYQDQAALHAILLRYFKNNYVLTPYSIFGYGPKHYQYEKDKKLEEVNSVFIHFGGAIKDSTAFEKYAKHYL